VGRNNWDVTRCYTTGTVSGINFVAGLVAVNPPPERSPAAIAPARSVALEIMSAGEGCGH